jgi:phytoene/squalene synthetase
MTLTPYGWKRPLLEAACGAVDCPAPEPEVLEAAYADCEQLTSIRSRSFSLVFRLLPLERRSAVHALYAFCRTVDDLVDELTGHNRAALEAWETPEQLALRPNVNPVAVAWTDARSAAQKVDRIRHHHRRHQLCVATWRRLQCYRSLLSTHDVQNMLPVLAQTSSASSAWLFLMES